MVDHCSQDNLFCGVSQVVLTGSLQLMKTRSKGNVSETQLVEMPAKRKRSAGNTTEHATSAAIRRKMAHAACQTCSICLDSVPDKRLVHLSGCGHAFCQTCVKQLVRTSLKDKSYPIICPEPSCRCALDPENDIRSLFITKRDMQDYAQLLHVAAVSCIQEKDRFYCPNAVCSALYQLKDNKVPARCKYTRRECHSCKQDFCMRCGVTWHAGFDCAAYQALPAEERSSNADLQVHAMAKEANWKRCPSCRYFVERSEGCPFMACHCGCNFDYLTGKAYDNGIGPADLFAEEWVEDHLAVLAAARQAAAAAMQLAAQRRAEAAQRQAVAVQVAQLQAAAEAHLEEMQALTAAHHHV